MIRIAACCKLSKFGCIALLISGSFGIHAQSVEVVQPDSLYFQNWVFTEYFHTPVEQIYPDWNTDFTEISLAGRTMTIRIDGTQSTGDVFRAWPNGLSAFMGATNRPANIAHPLAPAQVAMNRGDAHFRFDAPLPNGTTFFFSDVDSSENFEYHFLDCSGNVVDAGDFTFLQASLTSSTPPLTAPPNYSIEGTAPNRYWRVWDTTNANDPNSTNGIIIRSDEVCGVRLLGTRPGGGGSVNYSFGIPPAAFLNLTKSVASVNGAAATASVELGDVIAYDIVINNPESFDVTLPANSIQETLPAHTTLVSIASELTCTGTDCSNPDPLVVPAQSAITLQVAVQVDPGAVGSVVNAVAITNLNCAAAGNTCTAAVPLNVAMQPVPMNSKWALALMAVLLLLVSGRLSRAFSTGGKLR